MPGTLSAEDPALVDAIKSLLIERGPLTEKALRDALAESGWDLGPGEVAARELTGVLDGQQRAALRSAGCSPRCALSTHRTAAE